MRESFPDIVKIILTGYPDFKYAQDAINIGVVKYLLKPVGFEELSETVRLAADEINKRKNEKLQISSGRQQEPKREEKDIFIPICLPEIFCPFRNLLTKL